MPDPLLGSREPNPPSGRGIWGASGALVALTVDYPGEPTARTLDASERPSWHARAACRGKTAIMFPAANADAETSRRRAAIEAYDAAREICDGCPVANECSEAGAHERYGIWSGMSPGERRARRRETLSGRGEDTTSEPSRTLSAEDFTLY